jgi:hypothetical protein
MPAGGAMRSRTRAAAILLAAVLAMLLALLSPGRSGAATATAAISPSLVTQTFNLSKVNDDPRLVTSCPGSQAALGGGMFTSPPPDAEGEGVYPQSYERLGVQHAWHITTMFLDPTPRITTPRAVTIQAMCAAKIKHVTPPHTIMNLQPGQTKTGVAKCPGRRVLIGGGFQRTNFTGFGGVFATESRAISAKAWRVVAHDAMGYPGQAVALGYCIRSKNPRLTEVSGSTTLATGQVGTATTTPCPVGRLVNGGFSVNGSVSIPPPDAYFDSQGTWSATAVNTGPPATLTAYGYCLRA